MVKHSTRKIEGKATCKTNGCKKRATVEVVAQTPEGGDVQAYPTCGDHREAWQAAVEAW